MVRNWRGMFVMEGELADFGMEVGSGFEFGI
jgi:hypothetical protein